MGIIIRILFVSAFAYVAYNMVGDRFPAWKANIYETLNPRLQRASLIEELDDEIKELDIVFKEFRDIDLSKVSDPVLVQKLTEIRKKAAEVNIEQSKEKIKEIDRLNDKEGIISKTATNILQRFFPESSNDVSTQDDQKNSTGTAKENESCKCIEE